MIVLHWLWLALRLVVDVCGVVFIILAAKLVLVLRREGKR